MAKPLMAGPVATPEGAAALERVGFSAIAIQFAALPRFDEGTIVNLHQALLIDSALGASDLCVILDAREDPGRQREWCGRLEPAFVAIDVRQAGAEELLQRAPSEPARLLLLGMDLDYDSDPTWIEERLRRYAERWAPHGFILTLLPSLMWPIDWLRNEAGRHEEQLRVEEIGRVMRSFPVIVNMNMDEDPGFASDLLDSAHGFFFFLGRSRQDGGTPEICEAPSAVSAARTILSQRRLVPRGWPTPPFDRGGRGDPGV